MYKYTICTEADKKVFENQCRALETHIPGLLKEKRLHDVDGTEIQEYKLDDKTISVYNDVHIDAVYIESGVNIEPYFEKNQVKKREKKYADKRRNKKVV